MKIDMTIKRDQASAGKWSTNMSDKSSRASALLFQAQEKRRATSDYVKQRKAEHEKTTRLRALRLAKEAAERRTAEEVATEKITNKKPGSKHREAGVGDTKINKLKKKISWIVD